MLLCFAFWYLHGKLNSRFLPCKCNSCVSFMRAMFRSRLAAPMPLFWLSYAETVPLNPIFFMAPAKQKDPNERPATSANPALKLRQFFDSKSKFNLLSSLCLKTFQKPQSRFDFWPRRIIKCFFSNFKHQIKKKKKFPKSRSVFKHRQLIHSTINNIDELQYDDSSFCFIEKTVLWFFVCLKLEKKFWE